MGYYVSVSINLKSRKPPAQIAVTLQDAGFSVNQEDISQEACFSYVFCSLCDFKLCPESVQKLILSLMTLEPEPTEDDPQIVFCDDLEQQIWGYRISGDTAVPYVAIMQKDTHNRCLSRAELAAAGIPKEDLHAGKPSA